MPFTVSHAAVAAPLARRGLILSAVVMGSMAPDFQYFLTLTVGVRGWHVFPGLFIYAFPTALAFLWLFHRVLKQPLLRLVPHAHRVRLAQLDMNFPFLPVRRFALIVVSTLIGLFSHVGLDAFTHRDGIVVQMLPLFQAPLFPHFFANFALCDLLQGVGTVILSVILLAQYWRWFAAQPAPEPAGLIQFIDLRRQLPMLLAFAGVAGAAALLLARTYLPHPTDTQAFRTFGEYVLVGSMAFFGVEVAVFSLLLDRFVFRTADREE